MIARVIWARSNWRYFNSHLRFNAINLWCFIISRHERRREIIFRRIRSRSKFASTRYCISKNNDRSFDNFEKYRSRWTITLLVSKFSSRNFKTQKKKQEFLLHIYDQNSKKNHRVTLTKKSSSSINHDFFRSVCYVTKFMKSLKTISSKSEKILFIL